MEAKVEFRQFWANGFFKLLQPAKNRLSAINEMLEDSEFLERLEVRFSRTEPRAFEDQSFTHLYFFTKGRFCIGLSYESKKASLRRN